MDEEPGIYTITITWDGPGNPGGIDFPVSKTAVPKVSDALRQVAKVLVDVDWSHLDGPPDPFLTEFVR